MKIVPNIDVYGYGDSINVRCEVGFRYGGAIKRSCKPGNTWTGNEGTCESELEHKISDKVYQV